MDTIELVSKDKGLFQEARQLLNRVRKSKTPSAFKPHEFGEAQRSKQLRGYTDQKIFNLHGATVFIAISDPDFHKTLVTFHCSQYSSLQHLVSQWISVLPKTYEVLFEAKIRRLDLCVDIKIDFETIRRSIVQPKSRFCRQFESTLGPSLYLGKPPRQTYAYVKGFNHNSVSPWTRIEVRLKGQMLPIKRMDDVDELLQYTPFSHIRFEQLDSAITKDIPRCVYQRLDWYRLKCREVGAAETRKVYNRHRNFHRDIGQYLTPIPNFDIQDLWQRRIGRFLGERPQ